MTLITINISDEDVADLNSLAEFNGVEPLQLADIIFRSGLDFMFRVTKEVGSLGSEGFPSPPYPPIPSSFLDNNNNKQKELLSLNHLVAAKKVPRKKPKVSMPKLWVDTRDKETIPDGDGLLPYAEKFGYDWYMAKEMFIDFVDYHISRGNKFADWTRAWYKWVRNDTKFNGPPVKGKELTSVLRSYQDNTNPIEDMINGKE